MKLTSANVGANYELKVALDLLEKGFLVFRSLVPNTPFDLVAYANEKMYRIEVRAVGGLKKLRAGTTSHHKKQGDEVDAYAWVMGNIIEYECISPGSAVLMSCPRIASLKGWDRDE